MTGAAALETALHRALEVAGTNRFQVLPNPAVGAVVLDAAGNEVGRGATEPFGGRHAEIVALEAAGERARGGTLVCTLAPCTHTAKKTPPCAPAVVRAGIARVMFGCDDPNPATAGRAGPFLRESGVEVLPSADPTACRASIARFAEHLARDVPWTVAKWAMTADGRTGDDAHASRWITGADARRRVHQERALADAVLVGIGTVLADDPRLNCRDGSGPDPIRVVFDSRVRTPPDGRITTTARETPTVVLTTAAGAAMTGADALRALGVDVVEIASGADGRVDARAAMRYLYGNGVRRLLCEGGGGLVGTLFRAGLVHQVMTFVAPAIVGGARAPRPFEGSGYPMADALRIEEPRWTVVGDDALLEGFVPLA